MPPQGASAPQTPPQSSGPAVSLDSIKSNRKLVETVRLFVIYGTIMYVAIVIVKMLLSIAHLAPGYGGFSVAALVVAVITGIVCFVIGGVVFYFVFEPIHNWIKRTPFLSKHINDMHSLFWKPYLVVFVVFAALGLLGMLGAGAAAASLPGVGAGFGTLFIYWLVSEIVQIAAYYWYAKAISPKLAALYPW